MGVAPALTQTAVSQTQLYVANATIIQWLYPIKDRFNVNPCEAYFPSHLTVCLGFQSTFIVMRGEGCVSVKRSLWLHCILRAMVY